MGLERPVITPFGELPNKLAADMTLDEQHEWLAARITRRTGLKLGLGALAAISPALWVRPAAADPLRVFGHHLTYGEDPRTTMTLAFASAPGGLPDRAEVHLHRADGELVQTLTAPPHTVPGSPNLYHRVRLEGLDPDTSYRYAIVSQSDTLSSHTLRTAPQAGPFRFTAFGDQGVGLESQHILKAVAATAPRFHLLAGDLCYADSTGEGGIGDTFDSSRWDAWLRQNGPVTASMPWMCAIGNHEMEPGFADHGYAGVLARVPIGGVSPIDLPVVSSFRVGTVGFVALDSNDVSYAIPHNRGWTAGRQTAWLESQLASLRTGENPVEFIVAYMHHSPYCTSTVHASEGGIRDEWVPLFDRYSVDLVIAGHNHCYERTLPLRGGSIVSDEAAAVDSETGTTYITAGGGGASAARNFLDNRLGRVSTSTGSSHEATPWSLPGRTGDYLFLCIDVTPAAAGGQVASMRVRAVDAAGTTRDEVRLTRTSPLRAGATALSRPQAAAMLGAGAVTATVGAALLARGLKRPHEPAVSPARVRSGDREWLVRS